jgi:hypothetical protein
MVTSFTATPKTIKAGAVSTLQWAISLPTAATCTLQAAVVASPTCTADTACLTPRTTNVANLNTELLAGTTDANDPNNNGLTRTVIDALTKDALNGGVPGKGFGKKSLRIYNTTDFILNCGTPQKVRVQVADDTEA